MTIEHMKYLMRLSCLKEVKHITVDGLSELLSKKINKFNENQLKELV